MLELKIPASQFFDQKTETFVYTNEQVLQLEHSLLSISKWESKWRKPFLQTEDRTYQQTIDYIKCMTLNKNVDQKVYLELTPSMINQINEYINSPMTATWFSEREKNTKRNKQIITSQLIYYWMVSLEIPFECQKWHLNRLLTLIRVCNLKNQPDKKMKRSDIYKNNRALNAARRQQLHSKG